MQSPPEFRESSKESGPGFSILVEAFKGQAMRDCTGLVIRAQAGDREALSDLVAAAQDDVWHLLLSRCGNVPDAEDAAQETFAQVLASLPDLREPRAFPGWLFRIALDKAKRLKRRAAVETASEPVARPEADPVEREETRQAVRTAVRGLEETLRVTVQLRYEHGLAYADIARAMDCPEGTVADRLHTAHDRLRRALAGAGVAISLAFLEGELSAAVLEPAPRRLALRLAQAARGTPPVPRAAQRRRGSRGIAAGAAVALFLVALVTWMLGRQRSSPSGEVASGGTPGPVARDDGRGASGASPTDSPLSAREPAARQASAPGVLRGAVRDRDSGRGLPGAAVILRPRPDGARIRTVTDAGGGYVLSAPAGDYVLEATAPGYVDWSDERFIAGHRKAWDAGRIGEWTVLEETGVSLRPGMEASRDLELVPGVGLRGRVVDDGGRAVENAVVRLWVTPEDTGLGMRVRDELGSPEITTGPDGTFAWSGVWPRGRARAEAGARGFRPADVTVDVGPSIPGITLVLQRLAAVRVWGRVRSTDGRLITGARVFAGLEGFLDALPGETTGLGQFDYPQLLADREIVVWARGHGAALFSSGDVGPGGLDVVLPPAEGSIRGVVVDEKGNPVAGASVKLCGIGVRNEAGTAWLSIGRIGVATGAGEVSGFLPGDEAERKTVSAEDGSFTFDGVCVGDGHGVQVEGRAEGFRANSTTDVFEPGEARIVMKKR